MSSFSSSIDDKMWVFLSSINDENAVILQHFLLQMLVKPKEGGNEEEICQDPRHRVAEADTRPCQGWHQPETHTASRYHSITPLSIERLL